MAFIQRKGLGGTGDSLYKVDLDVQMEVDISNISKFLDEYLAG